MALLEPMSPSPSYQPLIDAVAASITKPVTEHDPPPLTVTTRNEFLTARQLAAILQVSESTVHRLAQKGRIPSISITPRIRRFHLDAVRDALNGNAGRARRKAAPPAAEPAAENPQLPFANFFE